MSRRAERIVILASRRFGQGRSMIRGILEGLGDRSRWLLDLVEPWPGRRLHEILDQAPAGVIVSQQGPDDLRDLASSRIPACVIGNPAGYPLPAVGSDGEATMRLAVEHLWRLRHPRLAWFGVRDDPGSEHLRTSLMTAASEVGIAVEPCPTQALLGGFEQEITAEDASSAWLGALPDHTGIVCANDICAWQVLKACSRIGRPVPESLAVLGCNNDELMCLIAEPTLSSIDTDPVGLGRLAARLLVDQLDGRPVRPGLQHLGPRGLVQRGSTAVAASADPLVRWAVNWIRSHLDDNLTIKRLVYESGFSRRTIEERFRQELGHSPLEEIHRQQVQVARNHLLIDRLDPAEAAASVGLCSSQQLNRLFRRYLGVTPTAILRQRSS